jgi:glycosyltransferase involved in cell wall biosynthesis
MSGGERIAVIIAAYNAAHTVGAVIAGARRHLEPIIVADDGSTDETAATAERAGAVVVRLPTNQGKGEALRVLWREARRRGCSAALAMDADGQHDPSDIPAFLRAHREAPDAIITGSRFGTRDRLPQDRRNSMTVARFFVSLAANQFIEESQCGFRLYPLAAVEAMGLLKGGYVTETELLMKAGDAGRRVVTLPIEAHYPPGQRSHFRAVPDVAAIARYVISYLMVKWGIEALRPGTVHSYRGPGTGRDAWHVSHATELVFEYAMVVAALPLTTLYVGWHVLGRVLGIPAVASLRLCGMPVGGLLRSVLLLPGLMTVAIVDLVAHRFGLRSDLATGFVRRHYSHAWARDEVMK